MMRRETLAVSKGSRKMRLLAAGAIVFLAGSFVFLWPSANAYLSQMHMNDEIATALKDPRGMMSAQDVGNDAPVQDEEGKRPKSNDTTYAYLLAYNEKVRTGSLGVVSDPWAFSTDVEQLLDAGLKERVVGSVSIPCLGVALPIYLGATQGNLAQGSCLVTGTSVPLGQTDSNCVLAAHRGAFAGSPMFRDIEDVRIGDVLTIETPWDTLVYRAVETKVIEPDDVHAVGVQPGRDLVTLLTCHPYGSNSHRYLVVFERVGNAGDAVSKTDFLKVFNPIDLVNRAITPSASPQLVLERWLKVCGMLLMLATFTAGLVMLAVTLARSAVGRRRSRRERARAR